MERFTLTIDGKQFSNLPKNRCMLMLIKQLCSRKISPEQINDATGSRRKTNMFRKSEIGESSVRFTKADFLKGRCRYFNDEDELIEFGGRTYALAKIWGKKGDAIMSSILRTFPGEGIEYELHHG